MPSLPEVICQAISNHTVGGRRVLSRSAQEVTLTLLRQPVQRQIPLN